MQDSAIEETIDCSLCIVGAGYAALNGLNVAAKYLKPGTRVVLIDKNETWGGQWTRQYDFVRLHQPYRMFTAGDQPWKLQRDPSYLATRNEVLAHLSSVPEVSAGHLELRPLFGQAYVGHRIRNGHAEVDVVPVSAAAERTRRVRVRAKRLLKATGSDIEILRPLPLSSARVRSVAVADPLLTSREFLDSDGPVYIIGSGKTAMDTVRHVRTASRSRQRPLHIVTGSGMWFFCRDTLYPRGAARLTQGSLTADVFLHMAQLFEGENEAQVFQALARKGLVHNVFGAAANCRYGLLSREERAEVQAAVQEVHRGHLIDVEGTSMSLREGGRTRAVPVAEGAWFINCTSHLHPLPYEPLLQDSGIVCAPQFALGFSGTSAYYITHLWYRQQLSALAPVLFRARLEVEPKLRFAPHLALMVLANMLMVSQQLPPSIPARFQGDFNKWYPLFRQLPTLARLRQSRSQILAKAERLLGMRFSDSPDTPPAPARSAQLSAEDDVSLLQ